MPCNNHKCVQYLCEEVPMTWPCWITLFEYFVLMNLFARGSFWYKCPPCTWDSNFSTLPPSPHFIHHFIFFTPPSCLSHLSKHVFRRHHLRNSRLGSTRVLLLFHFGMGQCFSIPKLSQWNLFTFRFTILIKYHIFETWFLKGILSLREDSNTLDGGHEPRIQPKSRSGRKSVRRLPAYD